MPDTVEEKSAERTEPRANVRKALADVTSLLRKHRLVEGLIQDQEASEARDDAAELAESAVYKRSKAALQRKLDRLHPADIAYILEALPLDERLYIWDLVRAARDGEILLEVSDAVRESLISSMDTEELVAATETLEADEIAELAPDLPQEVMDDVFQSLPVAEREQLRAAMSFDDDMVGALMDFEDVTIRRRRHARSRAPLSPPDGRAAEPDRSALRGRPCREAPRRAADQQAARHRFRKRRSPR